MPEQDKERTLPGESAIRPSSDEAISATLDDLRAEISGLSVGNSIVDGEILRPKLVDGTSKRVDEGNVKIGQLRAVAPSSNLSLSKTALSFWRKRQTQIKKAA